jgi:hypothetical protein
MIETIMWSDQAATTLLGKQDLYCSVYAYHKMTRSQRYRKVCNVTTLFLQERYRVFNMHLLLFTSFSDKASYCACSENGFHCEHYTKGLPYDCTHI